MRISSLVVLSVISAMFLLTGSVICQFSMYAQDRKQDYLVLHTSNSASSVNKYSQILEFIQQEPDSGLLLSRQLEAKARAYSNDHELSIALALVAAALADIDSTVEAIRIGRSALILANNLRDTTAMAWSLFAIGYASSLRVDKSFTDSANNAISLALLTEGLSFSIAAKNLLLSINFHNIIGRLYRRMKKYDEALMYHLKAYNDANAVKSSIQAGWAAYGIALCYQTRHQLDSALYFALESVRLRRLGGDLSSVAISLGSTSLIYEQMGDKFHALQYAKQCLRYADSAHGLLPKIVALERLSKTSEDVGQYQQALQYYKQLILVRDSAAVQNQLNDVKLLAQELEIERSKQEKLELLQQQRQQQQLLQERSTIAVVSTIIALALIVIMIVAGRLQRLARQKEILTKEYARSMEEVNHRLDEANQTLQTQNISLQELNLEKNEIIGIVAHDLKNPISAVRGFADLIQSGFAEMEQVQEISGQIVSTADRMLDLVKNLLEVNRLEQGGAEFHCMAFDIATMVESVVLQYQAAANAKNITLHYSLESSSSLALADEQALMQVLDNLVSNAVKYSPHEKNIFIRLESSDNAVRIEIRDEGPGISPDDMQKLFGKFARLSARPTGGEHSTGLGLSIVKKMVEAMNGRVWCESELGTGATFIVELPKPQIVHNDVSAE